MKRKEKSGGGGANWMDTYGDMVTLLLCFFVLLYSISSVDQTKWMALVKSFNPNFVETNVEDSGDQGPAAEASTDGMSIDPPSDETERVQQQQQIDSAIEILYEALQDYAQENLQNASIETTKGDGYVFISFDDAVFFAGESSDLLPEGQKILTDICAMFDSVDYAIDEIRIMGHTAQANANRPNDIRRDRFLSSDRATIATVFIQQNSKKIGGMRILSEGYGQHRPIDENTTSEGRSHNRRVEIIITGRDVMNGMGDSVEQYYTQREGGAPASQPGGEPAA